jgi:hypothetical protein
VNFRVISGWFDEPKKLPVNTKRKNLRAKIPWTSRFYHVRYGIFIKGYVHMSWDRCGYIVETSRYGWIHCWVKAQGPTAQQCSFLVFLRYVITSGWDITWYNPYQYYGDITKIKTHVLVGLQPQVL